MIVPQKMQAKLADKTVYSDRYVAYRFELIAPHKITNLAGQYIMLEVGEGEKRAYSMTDRPDVDSSFEILVDQQPNGKGINFLRQLQFGQTVELIAPLGQLVIKPELDASELVLIATGSGIAPFKSIITDQLQIKNSPHPLTLFWGMRFDDDLFWRDDFEEMTRVFSHFKFIPLVTRPSDLWTGTTGRITDYLRQHEVSPHAAYFLCGNRSMIDEIAQILTEKQIPTTAIFSEKFDPPAKPQT